jgi:hypothetical protein
MIIRLTINLMEKLYHSSSINFDHHSYNKSYGKLYHSPSINLMEKLYHSPSINFDHHSSHNKL